MAEHRDKKPGSRRAYLKDFKTDDSGRYSYQGKTLHSSRELSSYQKEIRTSLAAGCIPGTGMEGHVLMLLPYALGIGCTVRILWILGRLLVNGNSLREYVYKATAEKLDGYLMAAQVLPVLAAVDAVICMIRGTYHPSGAGPAVLLLSQALLFAAAFWTKKRRPAGTWSESRNS